MTTTVLDASPTAPRTGASAATTRHTSASAAACPRSVADALAAEVVPLLPLSDRIDALSLMFETGDGWRHERSWPFIDR